MLNILLKKLQDIIPIKAIVERNSTIDLEYLENNTPSESQLLQISNIIDAWPLDKAKLEKINLLDESWKVKLKTGWQTPDGYRLGIDISDVALLSGAFTLAKEASLIGMNDPVSIVDLEGNSHPLSLQQLTVLMLQYGQARATMSNSYATIKKFILESQSEEEVEAINISI
jgi:hypothetical protein